MNRKPLERDKFIRPAEFNSLLAWAVKQGDKRLRMFIFVGGALGLRQTEARTLNLLDNFSQIDESVVNIKSLKKGRKGGKVKENPFLPVQIDDVTKKEIVGYLRQFTSKDQPWLFPGRNGPISARKAVAWFKSAVLGAGLNPRYSFHALRHYRGITLWQQTGNLLVVKNELRHADVKVSEKYVHMDGKERLAIIKTVSPYGRGDAR